MLTHSLETSSDQLSVAVSVPSINESQEQQVIPQHQHRGSKIFWTVPVINALYVGGQSFEALYSTCPLSYSVPFALLTTISTLGISNRYTLEGIDDVTYIGINKTFPPDWPSKMSNKREAIALTSALIIGSCSAFICGSQAYFFAHALPNDYFFSDKIHPLFLETSCGTLAGVVVINMIFGKWLETYKTIRTLISPQKNNYANRFSRCFTPIIAGITGGLYAIENSLTNFNDVTNGFSFKRKGKLALLSTTPFDCVAEYCLNGRFGVEETDYFFGYLAKYRPDLKRIVAFTLSVTAAGILTYGQYFIVRNDLENTAKSLEIDDSQPLNSIITATDIGSLIGSTIVDTATLYAYTFISVNMIGYIGNKTYLATHYLYCQTKEAINNCSQGLSTRAHTYYQKANHKLSQFTQKIRLFCSKESTDEVNDEKSPLLVKAQSDYQTLHQTSINQDESYLNSSLVAHSLFKQDLNKKEDTTPVRRSICAIV